MTVSTDKGKELFTGDGSQTVFPVTFRIFKEDDIAVVVDDTTQTLTTDYTVTNISNSSFDVTFTTSPASGADIIVKRELDIVQETDYTQNDPFPAASHEDALDLLTMINQQQKEELGRTLKASLAEDAIADLPAPADRRGKLLRFTDDANADPGVVSSSTLDTALVLDEDDFASNSTTDAPSQQSTAAFIRNTTAAQKDDYSALKAIPSTELGDGDAFVVTGRASANDGGQGVFRWTTGDQSANVTTDPGEGVWVAPDFDATGATGAFKRQSTDYQFEWWGAVRDGSTDDATAIQNAIDFVESVGGGEIRPHAEGKYAVASTLFVDESHVTLKGFGDFSPVNSKSGNRATGATVFFWTGGATGPLLKFTSDRTDGGAEIRKNGGGLIDIHLDGNETCTQGFILESWFGGTFKFSTAYFTSFHWLTTCLPNGTTGSNSNTQHNVFRIRSAETNTSNEASALGVIDGSASANTSLNEFQELHLLAESAAVALECGNSDSNKFGFVRANTRTAAAGNGGKIILHADDTISIVTATNACRANQFYSVTAPEGITAKATSAGSISSHGNLIFGLTFENGTVLPTIESGASLWRQDDGAGGSSSKLGENGNTGYVRLPNGILLQWGFTSVAGSTTDAVNLPTAFPNNFYNASATVQAGADAPNAAPNGLSQINITNNSATTKTIRWMAIGD